MLNNTNFDNDDLDIPEFIIEKSQKDMRLSIKITDPLLKAQLHYYSAMMGSEFNRSMWIAYLIKQHVTELDDIEWPELIDPKKQNKG